jgi:hypothetical protein
MKFVFILEDDVKFQKELAESISAIDDQIQSRFFNSLEELYDWFKSFLKDGPSSIAHAGRRHKYVAQELTFESPDHELVLILFQEGMINHTHLGMLSKIQKALIDRKACKPESPTSMVLTTFDHPDFDLKKYLDPVLNNVIFKPFDKLILQQHLIFAIEGRKLPKENTLTNQQTTAVVEMLKDIQMEAISDVGFLTTSDRPIDVGSICKYYGSLFTSAKHRSVLAICHQCMPHPKDPKLYLSSFLFFAIDQMQITNMRKESRQKDARTIDHKWAPFAKSALPEFHVVCLDPEEDATPSYTNKIEQHFSGVKIHKYKSFGSLMADVDPGHVYAEGSGPTVPAFDGHESVELIFDQSGHTFLSAVNEKGKDINKLFTQSVSDLKNKYDWLGAALSKEHKEKLRKYCQSGLVLDDGILCVVLGENQFPIKANSAKKENGRFQLVLRELTKEERLAFLKANTKLSKPIHLVIASHQWFGEGSLEKWAALKSAFNEKFKFGPRLFMVSKTEFADQQEMNFSHYMDDIYYKPIDPVYLMQKIKVFFPALSERVERVKFSTVENKTTIKTVNKVKVVEISEAGFVMEYYRQLSIGSFREIVLWKPNELEAPEIQSTCNFAQEVEIKEKDKTKIIYKCQFIFFGAKDIDLKQIRLWIMENYVQSKESQAS